MILSLLQRPQTAPRRSWECENKQGGSWMILVQGYLNCCCSVTAITMPTHEWPERNSKSKTIIKLVTHQNRKCSVSSSAGMFQHGEFLQFQALPFQLWCPMKSIYKLTRDKHSMLRLYYKISAKILQSEHQRNLKIWWKFDNLCKLFVTGVGICPLLTE